MTVVGGVGEVKRKGWMEQQTKSERAPPSNNHIIHARTGVAQEAGLLEVDARAGAEGPPIHLVPARHVQLQQPARALCVVLFVRVVVVRRTRGHAMHSHGS